ncbi:MAG: A/G-specific adenine glycosylase (EC [uncultured Sulfurovum sp.]|uniref:Adenine DNA glycosylase n=1 Tax=uncultured Sulfurovum sp. TaxID=269237 RepID=A0A6S6SMK3_9BACT|nr:MAG: A/G-specific adenine glycosylase (EC [uncultured Sulfurovum sp.]
MKTGKYNIIHQNILTWYAEHGRVTLPWRNTNSAYEIYLSEIMLQQTQVKIVLERFYFQFLEKFPTFKEVATAPVDDVLKAWEGLGYYTRARNLHKTAIDTEGNLPNTAEELEKLSGIGKSTAHAVACFAFDEALPILDANVKRILYRFFAVESCNDKKLWELAYALYDKNNAYIYNQTMMDIGSAICTHKNPLCNTCPFSSLCQGKENPLSYPEKKKKKKKPIRKRTLVIYYKEDKYALNQNSERLLSGLWGFKQEEDFEMITNATSLGDFKQHYTHFTLEASVVLLKDKEQKSYFSIEEIHDLALSGADRKALALLESYCQ